LDHKKVLMVRTEVRKTAPATKRIGKKKQYRAYAPDS